MRRDFELMRNPNFCKIITFGLPWVPTHLHSDDGVDEEQHGNEQADIWQSLKTSRLQVRVKQRRNTYRLQQILPPLQRASALVRFHSLI